MDFLADNFLGTGACFVPNENNITDKIKGNDIWFFQNEILDETRIKMFQKIEDKTIYFGYSTETIKKEQDILSNLEVCFYNTDPVNSREGIRELVELGASAVYICGEICFDLKDISSFLREEGIEIITNINYNRSNSQDILGFFIRPEDIDLYKNYINYAILTTESAHQAEVLYNIYKKDKKWDGNLQEIIYNLPYEIQNGEVFASVGVTRLRCRQRCLTNNCNLCYTAFQLDNALNKNNLKISR